ncbi:MAG: hypothetical protein QOE41_3325 [Mycobacterium sp.]|nr:hypothetical protein [Mycobacterium sp.]
MESASSDGPSAGARAGARAAELRRRYAELVAGRPVSHDDLARAVQNQGQARARTRRAYLSAAAAHDRAAVAHDEAAAGARNVEDAVAHHAAAGAHRAASDEDNRRAAEEVRP